MVHPALVMSAGREQSLGMYHQVRVSVLPMLVIFGNISISLACCQKGIHRVNLNLRVHPCLRVHRQVEWVLILPLLQYYICRCIAYGAASQGALRGYSGSDWEGFHGELHYHHGEQHHHQWEQYQQGSVRVSMIIIIRMGVKGAKGAKSNNPKYLNHQASITNRLLQHQQVWATPM